MVVAFGAPVELVAATGLTGRERLVAATEQVRAALASQVAQAQERHQVFLPDDHG